MPPVRATATAEWMELAALHPAAADANTAFCAFGDWSRDGAVAIVSRSGN